MTTHSQTPLDAESQHGWTHSARHPVSWLEVVKAQVASLQFGSVIVSIHDGRVVQVETNTKLRFDKEISKS
jgi:hypothetical protein